MSKVYTVGLGASQSCPFITTDGAHLSNHQASLCVYEVDDPSIRDDPGADEIIRLRDRIAELENLVRELRGI